MKWLLIFYSLVAFSCFSSEVSELNSFNSDYCTLYFEGTRANPYLWKECCLEHDLYFWAGGSRKDRNRADLRLRSCVENKGALNEARLMYWAVTIGGKLPTQIKDMAWGNGWSNRPQYQSLSESETTKAIHFILLNNSQVDSLLYQSFKEELNHRLDVK